MINLNPSRKAQSFDAFLVAKFQKRQICLKQTINSPDRYSGWYKSQLSTKKTNPQIIQNVSRIVQLRNQLIPHFQSHKHPATPEERIPPHKTSITSGRVNTNNSKSVPCKQKTSYPLNKANFKRKSIKQYISQAALAKRKKNVLQASKHPRNQQVEQSRFNLTQSMSQMSNEKQFLFLRRLVPIQRTYTQLFQHQDMANSSSLGLKEEIQRQITITRHRRSQIIASGKPPITATLNSSQLGGFEDSKLQKCSRVRMRKKRALKIQCSPQVNNSEDIHEQLGEIGPWGRRNTIDSQLAVAEQYA